MLGSQSKQTTVCHRATLALYSHWTHEHGSFRCSCSSSNSSSVNISMDFKFWDRRDQAQHCALLELAAAIAQPAGTNAAEHARQL
eukprot:760584-Lingulodinium_polyedra.AAC.1